MRCLWSQYFLFKREFISFYSKVVLPYTMFLGTTQYALRRVSFNRHISSMIWNDVPIIVSKSNWAITAIVVRQLCKHLQFDSLLYDLGHPYGSDIR